MPGSAAGLGPAAQAALDEVLEREDPDILGVVLTGSAARAGMATEHSDVDVMVVWTDEAGERRSTSRSPWIDEIPQTLADLEDVPQWGGAEWGYRWGYCYCRVLRDEARGRIAIPIPGGEPAGRRGRGVTSVRGLGRGGRRRWL